MTKVCRTTTIKVEPPHASLSYLLGGMSSGVCERVGDGREKCARCRKWR